MWIWFTSVDLGGTGYGSDRIVQVITDVGTDSAGRALSVLLPWGAEGRHRATWPSSSMRRCARGCSHPLRANGVLLSWTIALAWLNSCPAGIVEIGARGALPRAASTSLLRLRGGSGVRMGPQAGRTDTTAMELDDGGSVSKAKERAANRREEERVVLDEARKREAARGEREPKMPKSAQVDLGAIPERTTNFFEKVENMEDFMAVRYLPLPMSPERNPELWTLARDRASRALGMAPFYWAAALAGAQKASGLCFLVAPHSP